MIVIYIHPRIYGRGEYELVRVDRNSQVLVTANGVARALGMWDRARSPGVPGMPGPGDHKVILLIRTEAGLVRLDPYKTWAESGVVEGTAVYRYRPGGFPVGSAA